MSILKLLRPKQWSKNLFIFLPMFFAGQIFNDDMLSSCIIMFIVFSFVASSIYCFNDIYDVEADKIHPEKCKRPIASGKISVKTAYFAMVILFVAAMIILQFFAKNAKYLLMILVLFYYIMNLAYCIKLKHYVIIDVMILAVGFVVRVLAGGVATGIILSEWIVIMTFLLALFLAFAKRRDDVVLYNSTGVVHRKNTEKYNLEFMNQVLTIIAAIIIVAYIMYTLSPKVIESFSSRHIYFTVIFVLMGIIRYLQITIVDLKSSAPEKILFHDRFIQCCIVGWFFSFLIIIYSKKILLLLKGFYERI